MAATMIATSVSTLPLFMVAALAVLIDHDLSMSERELGVTVSVFFACSALGSIPSGRMAERFGPGRMLLLATCVSGVCMLAIAVLARSWVEIAVVLGLAGFALAASGPAANLALARSIADHRQGIAFGLKQSAIPAATLAAGAAVPILGLTLGWRWAYGLLAVIGVVAFALVAPRRRGPMGARRRYPAGAPEPISVALGVLALAAMFGTAASNSLTAFFVASAVDRGTSVGHAGWLLAAGSLAAIVGRLFWGWLADRRTGQALTAVAMLWLFGAVGFALLSLAQHTLLVVVATGLAFVAGWGWNGLFHFAIVRAHGTSPAAATGVTSTGMFVGGMIGPAAFGFAAHRFSFAIAWSGCAALLLGAVGLCAAGRHLLITPRTHGVGTESEELDQ